MHSRLPRGVRPRLEGKPRTPPSSRVATRVSGSPLSGLKGVQPPLQFGDRTRDCSAGHAGKEGPQLTRTGASQGFPRAAVPVEIFSRGTTRISGRLSCGAREVRSPCGGDGDRVMALESREGNRASRRVEGLSRSFSEGGGKPSLPSPSAGDLRELPRVPLRGEGSCGGGGAPRDSAGSGATRSEERRGGKAKDSALLSSRDAGLLEPPERPQGSPASSSVWGQRGSLPQTRRGLTLLSQLCRDPAVGVRNAEEA